MARPESPRRVGFRFRGQGFRPIGRPAADVDSETLRLDELEALRLADVMGLYHEAAAERMGISRPTFGRVLARARNTVARAIFEERALLVGREGPVVWHLSGPMSCPVHGSGRRRGRGCRCELGRRNGHHQPAVD